MGQGLIALNEDFTINLINKMSQKLLSIDDNYEGSFLDLDIDPKLKENIVLVNKELSHISYDLKFDDIGFHQVVIDTVYLFEVFFLAHEIIHESSSSLLGFLVFGIHAGLTDEQ